MSAEHTPPKPWQTYHADKWEPKGECQHRVMTCVVDSMFRRLFGIKPKLWISRCTICGEKLPPIDLQP